MRSAFFRASRAAGRAAPLGAAAAGAGVTVAYCDNSFLSFLGFGGSKGKTADWAQAKKAVADILDDEKYMEEPLGPLFVRNAWHQAGTFCKHTKTGGSNGCTIRHEPEVSWGANAGLKKAHEILAPLKKQCAPDATDADFYVFAGTVAIEEMSSDECKIGFSEGRSDKPAPSPLDFKDNQHYKDGRLPSADCGSPEATAAHLRLVFNRMGFNDQEIVALSGAHGLGRCHTDRSGYWGPWTNAPTTFSNEYYKLLLNEKWTVKKMHNGKPWTGPMQYEDKTTQLMMLPSDLVLVQDDKFRPWVEKYAADNALFYKDFAKAYRKLMENGCANLTNIKY